MSGSNVDSFLALRDPSTIVGSNISAVWFKRGKNTWLGLAWSDQDQTKAIGHVKQELNISDAYDSYWSIAPNVNGATAPVLYKNGVLNDDPLQSVITASSDPESLLDSFVANGMAAASIVIEIPGITGGCGRDVLFEIIAEGVALQMQGSGDGSDYAFSQFQTLSCAADLCVWWSWIIAGPTKVGCTVGGWTQIGSPSWNQLHCAVQCTFEATVTCTYTRTWRRQNYCLLSPGATCTWTETGTKTGTVSCTSTEYFAENGCQNPLPGGGYTCPSSPDCNSPEPIGSISWTTVTPPC